MNRVKRVTMADGVSIWGYRFDCPGCDIPHVIPTEGAHAWRFNGDINAPTFDPSIAVVPAKHPDGSTAVIGCHSFVRNGRIEFLSDCEHALAGQTVDLPQLEGISE